MTARKNKRNVLHVTHCWGGGIPVYITDMQEALKDDFNVFVLKCSDGRVELEYGLESKEKVSYSLDSSLAMTEISNPNYAKVFGLILKAFEIDLVHINITLGHTFDIYYVSKKMNIPVVYTVHDFFYICPTFHLIDRNGMYCPPCEYGNEKDECLTGHPYINNPDFDGKALKKWRDEFMKVKDLIDFFIFPSFACKEIFTAFFNVNEDKCKLIYHGTSLEKSDSLVNDRGDEFLRVGILGSMLKHKGEGLFKYILENIDNDNVKFYHYGEGSLESSNLVNYGAYERSNILSLLKEDQIDVMLLLSTWPETFSYTLTESIAAGIPPIVTNLGSLRERVEKGKIGWVVDYKDPEKICELLRTIQGDRFELKERCERIKAFTLKSINAMREEYLEVYNSALAEAIHGSSALELKLVRHELEKIEYKHLETVGEEEAKLGPLEIFLRSMTESPKGTES